MNTKTFENWDIINHCVKGLREGIPRLHYYERRKQIHLWIIKDSGHFIPLQVVIYNINIRRSYLLTLSLVFIFDIWFTINLLHKKWSFVYITWISIVRYKTKKRNIRISMFMKGFSDLLSLIYFCAVFLE